ncbi:host attachment protein [Phenylobacterium sp.]|uniref:host attachment protein n=1 Tax=Phenylobacterium sp. TaxID=1871053 RepID=UPI0035B2F3D0
MIDEGVTWIVAADGAHMRVFEERRRAGEVRELSGEALRTEEHDRPRSHAHAATVHERAGQGRHGDRETPPAQEAETRFLGRAAERIDVAARRKAFERLVIMAPPHALGVLRQKLPQAVLAMVETTDAHNRLQDDAEAIRNHLRLARARA